MSKDPWVFIVNPVAGKGYAAETAQVIKAEAASRQKEVVIDFTRSKGHASELSEKYYNEGYKFIIGVGGDGTFNEVATPLAGKGDVVTGLVAAGTGNDFIQILGFPDRFGTKEWDALFKADTRAMDAGS